MRERDVNMRAGDRVQPAQHAFAADLLTRQRRNAEIGQGLIDEIAVRLWDQLVDVDRTAFGRHRCRHHDVDTVGQAIGIGVHPAQHRLEFIGVVEAHRPKDTHTAGPGDGRGHLLRRGEHEDRVFDTEAIAQFGVHHADPPCLE